MKQAGEFLVIVVYMGILYTLVRPGSQGPALVTTITGGLSNIIQSGMGGNQTWQ